MGWWKALESNFLFFLAILQYTCNCLCEQRARRKDAKRGIKKETRHRDSVCVCVWWGGNSRKQRRQAPLVEIWGKFSRIPISLQTLGQRRTLLMAFQPWLSLYLLVDIGCFFCSVEWRWNVTLAFQDNVTIIPYCACKLEDCVSFRCLFFLVHFWGCGKWTKLFRSSSTGRAWKTDPGSVGGEDCCWWWEAWQKEEREESQGWGDNLILVLSCTVCCTDIFSAIFYWILTLNVEILHQKMLIICLVFVMSMLMSITMDSTIG